MAALKRENEIENRPVFSLKKASVNLGLRVRMQREHAVSYTPQPVLRLSCSDGRLGGDAKRKIAGFCIVSAAENT